MVKERKKVETNNKIKLQTKKKVKMKGRIVNENTIYTLGKPD